MLRQKTQIIISFNEDIQKIFVRKIGVNREKMYVSCPYRHTAFEGIDSAENMESVKNAKAQMFAVQFKGIFAPKCLYENLQAFRGQFFLKCLIRPLNKTVN